MPRTLLLALLLAAAPLFGCGLPAPPNVPAYTTFHPETRIGDLRPYLTAYADAYDLPALAAAVVTRDSLVAIGVAGTRKRGTATPVTLEDRFHIGSCTKSMTATLAALLVADQVLTWETTVGDVLGAIVSNMDPAWHEVTLHHLLTNTGGVSGDIRRDFPDLWERFDGDFRGPALDPVAQRQVMAAHVLAAPPQAPPGTEYEYSNLGFALAGALLETVVQVPFETLMAQRLFAPLGMTHAGFGAPGTPDDLDQPWGHQADGTPEPPGWLADNAPMLSPAGRVHLTIGDWARYIQFHLAGPIGEARMLAPQAFERLHTPPAAAEEPYAMGWRITDEAGPEVATLVHTGSNTVWYSMVWAVPDRDLAVLVVANRGGVREEIDQTLWQLVVDQIERRRAQKAG